MLFSICHYLHHQFFNRLQLAGWELLNTGTSAGRKRWRWFNHHTKSQFVSKNTSFNNQTYFAHGQIYKTYRLRTTDRTH